MFLEVKDVSKTFAKRVGSTQQYVEALQATSLSMERGTFVSIIGPSGCGKSTLLRLIDGLHQPDHGEILIDGKQITKPGPDRGMVFQNHNLMPWRSVVRNVEFGLEMQGVAKKERRKRAIDLLEMVSLEEFVDFYPAQLSGGMQQRVGLVRALAIDPEIFLMDEPFGAVDALTRMALQRELEHIWAQSGKSVVFVTHDIEEALYLSTRVLVMSKRPGRIIEDVTVPFSRPRHPDIRGSAEFGELKLKLWEQLAVDIEGSGAGLGGVS